MKFYKISKSNQMANVSLINEIKELKNESSRLIKEAVFKIGEIIVTALITFVLVREDYIKLIASWLNLSTDKTKFTTIIGIPVFFLIIFFVFHGFFSGIKYIYKRIKDNKKTEKDRENLKDYFFTKIVNDITMGYSLEKRSRETINSSDDTEQKLAKMYLLEALYYFNLAAKAVRDKNIIEIRNKKRKNNEAFIKELNPLLILEIFEMSIGILNKIESQLNNDVIKIQVEDLTRDYNNIINQLRRYK